MLGDRQNCQDHAKFKELSALAGTGTLTSCELSQLNAHLENCEECHTIARQYLILKTQGLPNLAATYFERGERQPGTKRRPGRNYSPVFARMYRNKVNHP